MIFCFDAAFDVYTSIKWWVVNAPKFEPQRSPMRDDFVRSGGLYFGGIQHRVVARRQYDACHPLDGDGDDDYSYCDLSRRRGVSSGILFTAPAAQHC